MVTQAPDSKETRDDWNSFRTIMLTTPVVVLIVALAVGDFTTALPLAAFAACAISLFFFRRGLKRTITLHAVIAMLLCYQTLLLYSASDEPNIGIVWYLIVPAIGALLGSRSHILFWTPITLAAIVFSWLQYRQLPVFSHPMSLANLLGATLVVSYAALGFIAQRKRKEQELKNALRAAQVAEREARDARNATTRFLGSMSHELRTPLTSIALSAEVLEEKLRDSPDRHWPSNIQASTQSLLLLLNDVLSLARSDAAQVRRKAELFAVEDVLEAVRAITYPLALARRVTLFIGAMPDVTAELQGEPDRLRQVLVNLLNNALQHAEATQVWLLAENTSVGVRFSVGDNGRGIAKNLQDDIFQPFFRGADDDRNERPNGSGLGLAISAGYLKSMNSELSLDSEPGAGAVFSFVLQTSDHPRVSIGTRHPIEAEWPNECAIRGGFDVTKRWARAWLEVWAIRETASATKDFYAADDAASQLGSINELKRQLGSLRAQAPATLGPSRSLRKSLSHSLNCVVCDDDTRILDVLAARLKIAGHTATCFSSAGDMLDHLTSHTPDAIILDLHLAGESGLDALKQLRASQLASAGTPVCMLSGALDEREACLSAGADAYLFKPASGDELLETIQTITNPIM
ncbi:MAG: hybrid sensor histidine kinase/response regulator, partial [Pseudomonadota bacterium]